METIKYIAFLFIMIITFIIINNSINSIEVENFEASDDIYIKRSPDTEIEYLYPILKNVYPNKKIHFVDSCDNCDLVSIMDNQTAPAHKYIYTCGETSTYLNTNIFSDPNCVAAFVTVKNIEAKDSAIYLPYFVSLGTTILNESPFKRKYMGKRDRLAAYVARYSPPHREQMFKALQALDQTVDGLGKANHTRTIEMPDRSRWWDNHNIYKDYKFGFAMENTEEEGYITEKIMNVYRGGAIPIYWGTRDVKSIFHPDSFVYVNDYPSFEDAAKDIVAIAHSPERYETMRNAPIFLENTSPDYSKYYDTPSPQWVLDIAKKIQTRLNRI